MLPSPRFGALRRLVSLVAFSIAALPSGFAAEAVKKTFDLPADSADRAIRRFSEQAGLEVFYPSAVAKGVRTQPVKGEMEARAALDAMLAGTGLVVVQDVKTGAFSLKRASDPNGQRAALPAASDRPRENDVRAPLTRADPTAADVTGEQAVQLSPFEVISETDRGYTPTSTLAGARISTLLKETPAVIGVLTREFMNDIAAQDIREFGNWAPNVIVEGNENGNVRTRDLPAVTVRGLPNAFAAARNYFRTTVPIDSYNIERLEIPRGPNALLYGDGPLGGMATSNTKRASFGQNFVGVQAMVDSYESKRVALDVNRKLHPKLAGRVNLLWQDTRSWRDTDIRRRKSVSGTLSYRPWRGAQIRGEIEHGLTESDGEDLWYSEQIRSWNGTTIATSPNAGANGTGTSVVSPGNPYVLLNHSDPDAGLMNWRGTLRTSGSGLVILPIEYKDAGWRPGGVYPTPYLPSRKTTVGPRQAVNELEFTIYTLALEQTLFDKLAMEFVVNYEKPKRTWHRNRPNVYQLDLNPSLPNGAPNPRFMEPYADTNIQKQYTYDFATEYRGTIACPFDFGWMTQKVLLMGGHTARDGRDNFFRPRWANNPDNRNLNHIANEIWIRRYWNDSDASFAMPKDSNGFEVREVKNLLQGSKDRLDWGQIAATGSFFNRRLSTIVGIRTDRYLKDNFGNQITGNDWTRNGILTSDYLPPRTSDPRDANGVPIAQLKDPLGLPTAVWSSQRYDLINPNAPHDPAKNPRYYEAFPLKGQLETYSGGFTYFPVRWIGVFANASSGFQTQGFAGRINYIPAGALENTGIDVGLKLELFGGRVSGTVSTYRNTQEGYGSSVGTFFYDLWGQIGSGYADTAAIYRDTDAALFQKYNALSESAFNTRNGIRWGYNDFQELRAKGFEIDITANLTRNWRAMFNVGLPKARTYSRNPDTKAYYAENLATFESYAADTVGLTESRRTGIRNLINTAKLSVESAVDGVAQNGTPKYTANFFTTYGFNEGRLKGLRVGGGVQFRGPQAISTLWQTYGVNPANGRTEFFAPDLLDNHFVQSFRLFTLMAGYDTRLFGAKWTVQLNISNALDEDKILITNWGNVSYTTANGQPAGVHVPTAFRYLEPRKAVLSLSTRF
jgi:outer membrane receptor protein involved in Fe transport